MRFLSLLAVALAGCYDPAVADCQFACSDNKCPGDLTCIAGLCRVSGAPASCPCAILPQGCNPVMNTSGLCLAACSNARDWAGAQAACAATAPWRLAVLDMPNTRGAAKSALTTPISWIGLKRSSPLDWTWADGSGSIPSTSPEWTSDSMHTGAIATFMCAALNNGKLYADACGTAHAYACTSN